MVRDSNWPEEFDPEVYINNNLEIILDNFLDAKNHWEEFGKNLGLHCNTVNTRNEFSKLIDGNNFEVLEIGPFTSPSISGKRVKYADVYSYEELTEKAKAENLDLTKIPKIDYKINSNSLTCIPSEHFKFVFSAHVIEHQPDLIKHMQEVSRILQSGGYYFMVVPDRRYCFDYFIPKSSLGEIIEAHITKREKHPLSKILEGVLLSTHNDPSLHWDGKHGELSISSNGIEVALEQWGRPNYQDLHSWRFDPDHFQIIYESLLKLDFIDLKIVRNYSTKKNTNEFFIILKKCK